MAPFSMLPDVSVLFFHVSVRIYLTALSELLVCMKFRVKFCFTILCLLTYVIILFYHLVFIDICHHFVLPSCVY